MRFTTRTTLAPAQELVAATQYVGKAFATVPSEQDAEAVTYQGGGG